MNVRATVASATCGVLLLAFGCASHPKPTVSILGGSGDPVLAFAVDEISSALAKDYLVVRGAAPNADWVLDLAVDTAMAPYSFSLKAAGDDPGRTRVELRGPNQAGVLHAAYTMLEAAGVRHDITGLDLPERVRLDGLRGVSRLVRPAVERRGIRLHVNFAMDISSYPLDEAKAYIRNLARLRMNTVTFHSYPGQWYPASLDGGPLAAGHFFYGQRHDVPDEAFVKRVVRNARVFSIPEIEPYYDQPVEKGRRATAWLRAVISEAKRVGLTVNFSLELRDKDTAVSMAACDAVIDAYPMIDGFEIITQEDSDHPVEEVENNARALGLLRERWKDRKPLEYALGIYNTTVTDLTAGFDRLRHLVPPGVRLTILPAHGARMAVKNLLAIPITAEDVARTTFYSWAEFDGLMYLQQNPVEGIRQLVVEAQRLTGGRPVSGILLNHWRTAENRTSIGYAALATIEGPIAPADFYRRYGSGLGVGAIDSYVRAMSDLDEADDDARMNLFNIGFCYGGYWSGRRGLANYGRFPAEKIDASARRFEAVRGRLAGCLRDTRAEAGRRYLEFLVNRISCTLFHLGSFRTMAELQPLFKARAPEAFTAQDRRQVREVCDRALAQQDQYLRLHAQMIEDRGAEGTLLSYYYSAPRLIKQIEAAYGGEGGRRDGTPKAADAPPSPTEKRKPGR